MSRATEIDNQNKKKADDDKDTNQQNFQKFCGSGGFEPTTFSVSLGYHH